MSLGNINNQSNVSSDEISLKELLLKIGEWRQYLLSKWAIILAFGVLGSLLGFTYAYFQKPVYTATTTFVLEDGGSSNTAGALGSLGGLASIAGIDIGGSGGIFQGDNIIQLYKSRSMIEKTLLTEVEYNGKHKLLVDLYIDFNKLRDEWAKKAALKNIQFHAQLTTSGYVLNFTRLQDSILGIIVKDINKNYLNVAKPDKKLSVISAEVKAQNEFFAKAFNEQIVKNVNDFYVQTKTKKSIQNVQILQQKTDSVRKVMNGEIYSAAAVADATPNLNPTRQAQRIAPVQRSQFSVEANKAMLSALIQNLEMSKIALRKETPLIQVIDEPILPLDKQGFGKLKGIIIGGLCFGFLVVGMLIIRRIVKLVLTT
ncbi:Wzz/FepE/Etk N-terminal domain-containing protein [Pedobacter foliorum]|uniref:Wzz/FepE/Etk N-terminal domain-containing protein n=1 Tax=Pedobacter foliorum TaxID=2739058 RepID=UPI0015645006|nr:Wzz/FepE/Etk N-terminal domain-containing protein [Pedobacter foliorum]NRF39139.1 lipopolysaccharide biosynthesis protein [Pedobacter foliorum]